MTVAVPSWRNDVAAPGGPALDQDPGLDPAAAAAAADGCALVEPECDLIEEVLRLRGLDAVPAVSLPRAAPVPLPTLTRGAGPRGAGAAGARRAGPGRMRDLQLHGRARGGAVRRRAGGAATGQPDRRRPRPAAPDAGRHPGAGGGAQRRARALPTWRCSRSGRSSPPRASGPWRPGCAPAPRRATGARPAGRWTRWTPRPICSRRCRRWVCRWRACR